MLEEDFRSPSPCNSRSYALVLVWGGLVGGRPFTGGTLVVEFPADMTRWCAGWSGGEARTCVAWTYIEMSTKRYWGASNYIPHIGRNENNGNCETFWQKTHALNITREEHASNWKHLLNIGEKYDRFSNSWEDEDTHLETCIHQCTWQRLEVFSKLEGFWTCL